MCLRIFIKWSLVMHGITQFTVHTIDNIADYSAISNFTMTNFKSGCSFFGYLILIDYMNSTHTRMMALLLFFFFLLKRNCHKYFSLLHDPDTDTARYWYIHWDKVISALNTGACRTVYLHTKITLHTMLEWPQIY